jgi:hypothetical protein
MIETKNLNNPGDYDTTINVIGGIKDYGNIYKAIEAHVSEKDSFQELILDRNEFNLRTEKSRLRIQKAIEVAFLNFQNQNHLDLFNGLFKRSVPLPGRELILFWQFSLSNRLFREISTEVFTKIYFSGRASLSKDDITAYLKEFLSQNKHLNLRWSENTILTLSTKYLNIMTKLNFLEGARTKTFKYISVSAENLTLFLYFARLHNSESQNILKNEILPLSFVSPEDLLERLKKLSMKDFYKMNFNGVDLNIELIHSYKGICNVLYNR